MHRLGLGLAGDHPGAGRQEAGGREEGGGRSNDRMPLWADSGWAGSDLGCKNCGMLSWCFVLSVSLLQRRGTGAVRLTYLVVLTPHINKLIQG